MSWSVHEVRQAIEDYVLMLTEEMHGRTYNKTEHRRALCRRLVNRTDASVERKHQNISAVLIEMGLPYIDGYKPLCNYQHLLREEISGYFRSHPDVFAGLVAIAESDDFIRPQLADIENVLVAPPDFVPASEPIRRSARTVATFSSDFLEREARNIRLARLGQEYVVEFERRRLRSAGQSDLANRVQWVTESRTGTADFDISSFAEDGSEHLILVKTTTCGRSFPFYVSSSQKIFSEERASDFSLYRVFRFPHSPRLFMLQGEISSHCRLETQTYRASFGRIA